MAHPDGFGLGWDAINWVNVAQEADESEALVTTQDLRQIPRWSVGGSYRMSEDERNTVLQEFLKAGDGFIWQDADGLVNIRCGRWEEPTVTITEKHIKQVSAQLGPDATERANEVRVIYTEPNNDYTETEADPTIDADAQLALGRAEVSRFDAYYCPEHNQAKRIGKRILARLGERWQLQVTTDLYGLNALNQRFVKITISELGLTETPFEVSALQINPGDLEAAPTITLGLLEVEAADFDFNAATEEGAAPGLPGDTVIPITIPDIEGLLAASENISLDGSAGVGIGLNWDAPTRSGLRVQAQFRQQGDSQWTELPVSTADRRAVSGVVNTGQAHDVRVRYLSITGRPGAWAEDTITPTAVMGATSIPTQLSAGSSEPGEVLITWRNPTESNFAYAKLFRSTTDDFGTASQVGSDIPGGLGQVETYNDTVAAGTYYYWVEAFNSSSLGSGETASVSVTVS